MSWFKFFKYICNDIDKINTKFFWNNNKMDELHSNRHSIKSIACDRICRPKCESCLGVRKMEDFNVVYLGK